MRQKYQNIYLPQQERASTGVAGLDHILGGVRHGHRGLYITPLLGEHLLAGQA